MIHYNHPKISTVGLNVPQADKKSKVQQALSRGERIIYENGEKFILKKGKKVKL